MNEHRSEENSTSKIEEAVRALESLHAGDHSILDVVASGKAAVPALRRVLFRREPSGLFQVRCRAVEALAALEANEILVEFLRSFRAASDPIERLGDDAVINAAALAVAKRPDEQVFHLLLDLARRPCLTGVIGALGSFNRVEAIPSLIDALEEDASRLTAEKALMRFGILVRHALMAAAELQRPSWKRESVSSRRRRQSAVRLMEELRFAGAGMQRTLATTTE